MKVADLLAIRNGKGTNREKAELIARGQRAAARRNNPRDTDIPSGWDAGPYPGARTDHTR